MSLQLLLVLGRVADLFCNRVELLEVRDDSFLISVALDLHLDLLEQPSQVHLAHLTEVCEADLRCSALAFQNSWRVARLETNEAID